MIGSPGIAIINIDHMAILKLAGKKLTNYITDNDRSHDQQDYHLNYPYSVFPDREQKNWLPTYKQPHEKPCHHLM